MAKKLTRRQFLAYTALGIGASTLICGGLGALAFRQPVDVQFQKLATKDNPMKPKVLVAYATRAGSTMEIARAISQELEKRSFTVDISPIDWVKNLDGYSHVVIGTAVRMAAPLPEVTQFITEHQSEFKGIPFAFFAVHLQNDGEDEASQKARLAYLDPIRKLMLITHEAFFTGVYDPTKVSFIEGLMGKMVKTPVGDFRDWTAIKDWGQSIFTISSASRIERELGA